MMKRNSKSNGTAQEVKKPFLTGSAADENTVKNSLAFFGIMIVVFIVSLIACVSASFDSTILRLLLNGAVIIVVLLLLYNNGGVKGAEAVARGEILYQKKERGEDFSESERKICYHPMKGYLTGLLGTIPFLAAAVILAVLTVPQVTGAGTLPSWMQTYTRRGDIGNALVNYTQPEGMTFLDYIRALIRICIIPFVNIIGSGNKYSMAVIERLSPIILLLPAAAYGTGYMQGKKIRSRIHTAINENDRRRIRREKKKRAARNNGSRSREPEQLN